MAQETNGITVNPVLHELLEHILISRHILMYQSRLQGRTLNATVILTECSLKPASITKYLWLTLLDTKAFDVVDRRSHIS